MKRRNLEKRTVGVLLAATLVFGSVSLSDTAGSELLSGRMQAAAAEIETTEDELGYAEGEILIVYQDDVSGEQIEDAVENRDGEILETVAELEEETVALVSISDEMTVEEAVEAYSADPAVACAEPNYIMQMYDTDSDTSAGDDSDGDAETGAILSSDDDDGDTTDTESTSNQWYLSYVSAQSAWAALAAGDGSTVRVAVIDTGADISHEELAGVINEDLSVEVVKTERSPGNYYYSTRTLQGDGFLNGTNRQNSSTTHGTHVSGIIAAEAGNGVGIQGTASGGTTEAGNQIADLVVIDAFTSIDSSGEDSATVSDVLYAMQYAADIGCRVINLSMGMTSESSSLEAMCTQLYEDGIVIVCAAGNTASTGEIYPADYTSTISVINITSSGKKSSTSSYGSAKDISAPGTAIYSTTNGGGYGYMTGTSMAAPIVTSAAAMLLYVDSDLTPSEVKSILCETATDLMDEGKDDETGYGAVNILAAVESAIAQAADKDTSGDSQGDASGNTGGESDGDSSDNTGDENSGDSSGNTGEENDGDSSVIFGADTLVIRRGNTYHFRYSLTSGDADVVLDYGREEDEVYFGDWDGDGVDTPCVRRGNRYYFKNSLTGGNADFVITYGRASDTVLIGDWDGDGVDTLCVRRGNKYYFKNDLKDGNADQVFTYGRETDTMLAGDWDGDGVDTLCVRRGNIYYVKNSLTGGSSDDRITYGRSADAVLVGDWDGDGVDTLCVRRGSIYYFINSFKSGVSDFMISYGRETDQVYAGTWY